MKNAFKVVIGLVLLVVVIVGGVITVASVNYSKHAAIKHELPEIDISGEMKTADLETGKRIVTVRNGCYDCHGTDLGGTTIINDGPAGLIAGSNITPFKLADWSDGEIARAIRYGVGKDGLPLVFMPSTELQNLSKQDLASLVAYLRTVPKVEKENVEVRPGPIMKIMHLFGKIPHLLSVENVDRTASFPDKPAEEPTPEFGKYLVTAACTGCHGVNLAGGPIAGGPPEWPPAADLRGSAMGKWTQEQFIKAMREGVNPSGAKIRLPMPIEMTKSLSDQELIAMYTYLKGV